MRKAIGALLLAAVMLSAAGWNIRHVRRFTGGLTEKAELCRASLSAGDSETALSLLYDALDDWRAGESYTYVFIRHGEADAVTDAFFDAAEAIANGEAGAFCALDRLEAHLACIDSMERITVKSVF